MERRPDMSGLSELSNSLQELKLKEDPSDPRRLADLMRWGMGLVEEALQKGGLDVDTAVEHRRRVLDEYGQVMDSRIGVDNYWEGAKTLAAQAKNESQTWTSKLTSIKTSSDPQRSENSTILHDLFSDEPDFSDVTYRPDPAPQAPPPPPPRAIIRPPVAVQKMAPFGSYAKSRSQASYQPPASFRSQHPVHPEPEVEKPIHFQSASSVLKAQMQRKRQNGGAGSSGASSYNLSPPSKKSLGTTGRGPSSKFVPPWKSNQEQQPQSSQPCAASGSESSGDGFLSSIDPKLVEMITNEIMDRGPPVTWDDIAGLEFAKTTVIEIVVLPMVRPDLFNGLRQPPKGLLLFGPPGTGKTLIGKCIASQSQATFFSISASSLTSKWVGEGEKLVRALFAVARDRQPSVIFIDEIDSLLTQRSDTDHEGSRRMKTEFLVQLDGATTDAADRVLVVGATNRPQELDEAARRRLVKRLYVPLPEANARQQIVTRLLSREKHNLTEDDLQKICSATHGFSGADMTNLCKDAALGPIRDLQLGQIQHISANEVRPISYTDFEAALRHNKPSVSENEIDAYIDWNKKFGCCSNSS